MFGAGSCGKGPLTEGHERGDDGQAQGGEEQVDAARQTGDLPDAGVSQADDVGVGMVHLDVPVHPRPRWEGATDLVERETGGEGQRVV